MFTLVKMTLVMKEKKGPEQYINCKDYPDTTLAHKSSSKVQARNFLCFWQQSDRAKAYYWNQKGEAKDFEKVYPLTHQDRPFTVKLRYWKHQKYF